MPKTTEEKIDEMHDTLLRLEPYLKRVDKLDECIFNGGWGLAAQVKALIIVDMMVWAVFLIWLKNKV